MLTLILLSARTHQPRANVRNTMTVGVNAEGRMENLSRVSSTLFIHTFLTRANGGGNPFDPETSQGLAAAQDNRLTTDSVCRESDQSRAASPKPSHQTLYTPCPPKAFEAGLPPIHFLFKHARLRYALHIARAQPTTNLAAAALPCNFPTTIPWQPLGRGWAGRKQCL